MLQVERAEIEVETEPKFKEGPVAVFIPAPVKINNTQVANYLASHGVKTRSRKDPTPESIKENIGIQIRYCLQGLGEAVLPIDQTVPKMAVECAKKACEQKFNPEDIDVLIVSTSLPFGQKLSDIVAQNIGAKPKITKDVITACTGSIIALGEVKQLCDNNEQLENANVLIVSAEHVTSKIGADLIITMFADGAAAFAFQNNVDIKLLDAETFHEKNPAITMPIDYQKIPLDSRYIEIPISEDNLIHMDGTAVIRFIRSGAVIERIVCSYKSLQTLGRRIHIVAHPGSYAVLKNLQEKLHEAGLDVILESKTLKNYGNYASASALAELCLGLQEGQFKKGDIVFMPGVAAGLNYASVAFEILKTAAQSAVIRFN